MVGGGIGGLSAAIALQQRGHEVTVFERARQLDRRGAGITLFGNGIRALGRLHLEDHVAKRGARARSSSILARSGRVLSRIPPDVLSGALALHRADLQAALASQCADVRLHAAAVAVGQERDAAWLQTQDGSRHDGDLLVGADGERSLVRESLSGPCLRYSGYTAWRGICPVQRNPGQWTETWGCGGRFGLVDIGNDTTYWFATKNAPEQQPYRPEEQKRELTRRFAHWHPLIAEAIGSTEEVTITRTDVYYLGPPLVWRRGRIALLGDAAHAATPAIGQGAAQAIEDAVALADSISRIRPLAAGLEQYERARRPPAEAALHFARRMDRAAQAERPMLCRLRDALVNVVPSGAQRRYMARIVG